MPFSYHERSESVQADIFYAYASIAWRDESVWGLFNGSDDYKICGLDSFSLLQKTIQSNPEQKDFYILDVGAGNFQFTHAMAQKINEAGFEGRTFHLIGLRGETNTGVEVREEGVCKIYDFGAFPIENMRDAFAKKGMGDIKFDFVISSWTLRHLVDPVGTMIQIHEMLATSGYFLFDGFFLNFKGSPNIDYVSWYEDNMDRLMYATHEPFMKCDSEVEKTLGQYVLKKTHDVLELPFVYHSSNHINVGLDVKSKTIQVFELEDKSLLRAQLSEECSAELMI